MIEFIAALFTKIGMTIGKLVEVYAARAPAEWADPIGFFVFSVLFGAVAWSLLKYGQRHDDDDFGVAGFVFCFASIISLIVCFVEFSEAVKATVAPQAYAVDQILDKLGDLK